MENQETGYLQLLIIYKKKKKKTCSNREQVSPVRWGLQTSLSLKEGSALFTEIKTLRVRRPYSLVVGIGGKDDLAVRDHMRLTSSHRIFSLDIEMPLDSIWFVWSHHPLQFLSLEM
ncbi:hypothetical protein TNCV_3298341 [Trichonephila clavipes]|uniref:Uncharacterized protein n=1 Tax=Trichonephila clavipes TaxID=2585209 RepID=A0A8X6VTK5_TRICX|nr:hypothetical protein TNCV_3298341 [Trichonephila clavipes]